MEECAGRTSNIAGVRWFVAPDVWLDGEWYRGYWWENGNRILLAQHAVSDGRTVRHEMLHAILQRGDHPAEYFGNRCGGEVGCRNCFPTTTGASAAELEHAIEVPPSALEVSVEAAWPDPAHGVEPGLLAIIVRARNPFTHPVWVRLPTSMTFGVELLGAGRYSTSEWTMEPRYFFRAGQERRMVSDLRLCGPGSYTMRGYFSDAVTERSVDVPETEGGCPLIPGLRDQSQPPTARSASHPSTSRGIIGT